ncbi:MAG: methyltransferase family protein [Kiloniellaceae bacterium]
MWKALLILPFNVTIAVPAAILWLSAGGAFGGELPNPATVAFWTGAALLGSGLFLMAGTMRLFRRLGEGTPAPWDPPKRMVIAGPYRHVRNPMIGGVIAVLFGEAAMTMSPGLLAWAALFLLANMIYIPLFEEPGLERRFGEDYRTYRRHVPRWIPRLTPWRGFENGS